MQQAGLFIILSAMILGVIYCEEQSFYSIPEGEQVNVLVDPFTAQGVLDEMFLGYAFDTAQFTGGKWWREGSDIRQIAETPDLESTKLRNLVSYLSPSLMRIGGTDCDGAYFCPGEGDCTLPAEYADAFIDKDNRVPSYFTHEDIRRAAEFAQAVGSKIMFCVNVGSGPRDPVSGLWQPDNAQLLIQYANSLPQKDVFYIWEPGNEVNAISFHFNTPVTVDANLFSQDIQTFRTLVNTEDPGALVCAPGCYFHPLTELPPFTEDFMQQSFDYVDIVTWHLYATQSHRTNPAGTVYPASKENLFNEEAISHHRDHAQYVQENSYNKPVWNGECASAQSGGEDGISDTMLDALWYVDWIGIMASEGTSAVVRQVIVGSDYGLLDPETYDPRPTFLAMVMMRRTMAHARLSTDAAREDIKAHAYYHPDNPQWCTVVLVNTEDYPKVGKIKLQGIKVKSAQQWTVWASGDLYSDEASINEEYSTNDGIIPYPEGESVAVNGGIAYPSIPAHSVVFVVLDTGETLVP